MKTQYFLFMLPVLLTALSAQADIRTYNCKTATTTLEAVVNYNNFPVQLTSLKIGDQPIDVRNVTLRTVGGAPQVTVPGFVDGDDFFFTLNRMQGDIYRVGTDPETFELSCQMTIQKPEAPAKKPRI